MAEDGKKSTASKGQLSTAKDGSDKARNDNAPTAQEDRENLRKQLTPDVGRKVDIEVNPPEVQENSADWQDGRDPNDVVEVEGQRETVEARMARNGVNAPEKAVGATTKAQP